MTTYRPAVKENDGYIQKLIKYIPAEVVAGYTALVGYLSLDTGEAIPHSYRTYYILIVCFLGVITPLWTYFSVYDAENNPDMHLRRKRAIFHAIVATLAFLVWIYALGNPILKLLLCDIGKPDNSDCTLYSPVLGSIVLTLFTIMTPLLERIFFRTTLPASG